ncbi:MAG: hypothetical protein HOV86_15355 [Thermoactinospora sp.]|nr:hypothetical protein [Thermoactinospora sp.]
MTAFACTGCDTPLTAPLSRVTLPVHAHQRWGHDLMGVLMEPGTYAIDPHHRDAPGAIVIAPGDIRDTVLIPDRCLGMCCGTDEGKGPNLACLRCGTPVAVRIDDCGRWQSIWLHPPAVRTVPGPERPITAWDDLAPGTPPVYPSGAWNPIWAAAIAETLAHILALSDGAALTLPHGLLTDTLRIALDALIPHKPPATTSPRTLALAGPGLLATPATIAVVPRHPQTGHLWSPGDATQVVPLAAEVWTYLAHPHDRIPAPVVGALPDDGGYTRARLPYFRFEPDADVFLATLARLPQLRQPWLRAIHDQVNTRPRPRPF